MPEHLYIHIGMVPMPTREVKCSHHVFLRMLTVQGILSLEEGHVLLSSFNVF